MKRIIYNISMIVLMFSLFSSCQKNEQQIEQEELTLIAANMHIDPSYKWLVILPGLGCHGCIQEGEAFMKDYIQHQEVLFVLTNVSSLKILQQKTGIELNNHPNVFVDHDNVVKLTTNNVIYPCIVELEKGQVVRHEFQSPQNGSAFKKLKDIISAK